MVGKRVTVAKAFPFLAAALMSLAVLAGARQGRAFAPSPSSPEALAAAEAAGPVSTAATGARCIGSAFDDTAAFQAAIDTGRTVYAPALGGHCHITHALVMKTPGQIFHGDGRARTKIEIEPGFTGDGVFVAKTGGPGPVLWDFGISFEQPDTQNASSLVSYPPAFYLRNTPAFSLERLACYRATICVDMKGNSGNSKIFDFQFDAFLAGIQIDGSEDVVRLNDLHWWPFDLSAPQQRLFAGTSANCPIGVSAGRVDGLLIQGGLLGGCLGLFLYNGEQGNTSGNVVGTVFDSYSGIRMQTGTLSVVGSSFSQSRSDTNAISVKSGSLLVSSSTFLAGSDLDSAVIEAYSPNSLSVIGCVFLLGGRDITVIKQLGGILTISLNTFEREAKINYRKSAIEKSGGQLTFVGNTASALEQGRGQMLRVQGGSIFDRIDQNVFPGWQSYNPLGSTNKR